VSPRHDPTRFIYLTQIVSGAVTLVSRALRLAVDSRHPADNRNASRSRVLLSTAAPPNRGLTRKSKATFAFRRASPTPCGDDRAARLTASTLIEREARHELGLVGPGVTAADHDFLITSNMYLGRTPGVTVGTATRPTRGRQWPYSAPVVVLMLQEPGIRHSDSFGE
jgi:hypothetical protein